MLRRGIFTGVLLLLAAATGWSQTAQINGRVEDSSGAALPGAAISVRSEATGLERRSVTNEVGLYTIPLLQAGAYTVTVSRDGFRTEVRSGIQLVVEQRAELNFVLQVGAVSERLEVSAGVSRLNTVEASLGQVIDNQRVVDLPLSGRNYLDLALLSGGAVQAAPGSRLGGFSTAGQRVTQNNYMLDGIDNNQVELSGAGRRAEQVQPSVDAVQEFKVQTNSYAAEFGRGMGGVVNLTIKSRTNEVHGAAFEFVRNEIFDARNFFTPPDRDKPPFIRNQFGLALGGPVFIPKLYNGKNKTFFFGDFESTRIRETATIANTIPTMRMRQGDFSELPASRRIRDLSTGQPFPDSRIPASRFDPVGARLIQLYPVPQTANLANNYTHLSPRNQDVNRWDIRTDQTSAATTCFSVSAASTSTFRTRPACRRPPSAATRWTTSRRATTRASGGTMSSLRR